MAIFVRLSDAQLFLVVACNYSQPSINHYSETKNWKNWKTWKSNAARRRHQSESKRRLEHVWSTQPCP